MPCPGCGEAERWKPGKHKDDVPRNEQGMRELCAKCKEHNILWHSYGTINSIPLCKEHFDLEMGPKQWQLFDCDGNLLGRYNSLSDLSTSIADKLRFCEDRSLVEDILKYRIKNKGEVTIEKGLLTCLLCGGHEFILVEGGYDRIDRCEYNDGKVLLGKFQGFSEGGDGETMLSCVSDGCVADSRFPIPEGIEVDYD
jgi:hypothetical protein